MIPATPALLETFAPYTRNFGDVQITNVPAPINALGILLEMGLPVSKKIVVMELESPYLAYTWNGLEKEKFISSYQYLEEVTEDESIQNNVATYNPAMKTLTIHYHNGKNVIGRGHNKNLAKNWLDASFCFVD
jgi:hypothetical protein